MADFFRTSTLWVVDFRYDGRARRWFRAFGPDVDVQATLSATLHDLYGRRARLVQVRRATDDALPGAPCAISRSPRHAHSGPS